MDAMKTFDDVVENPGRYAAAWKAETGGKVVGHFCSYTPEEIVTAAGALPYRILGTDGSISRADAHLQAYSCSLVRGGLEDALAGKFDFMDATVFPHTCDSIQRLSDIWRMNIKTMDHFDIVLPVKLNTDAAKAYMADVLQKFREELGQTLGVTISDDRLNAAIVLYNRIRKSLARLYNLRRDTPKAISSSQVHTVFKASMIMDRTGFADAIDTLLDSIDTPKDAGATTKRLVLTGGLCSMPDIYHVIEEAGGAVVWDDFCTGSRYFEGEIPETPDPVAAISDRYLTRVVCPAKHSGTTNRGDYLIDKVKELQADGVIFMYLKFCDPHAFDYPYMKGMLDDAGIPSTLFEIEDQTASEGQLRTRCEAFIEML